MKLAIAKLAALVLFAALLCLACFGCRYYHYREGEAELTAWAAGTDTQIGKLAVKATATTRSLEAENYDSKAKAIEMARQILEAAK